MAAQRIYLVVPLKDGRIRKYRTASQHSAMKRLEEHRAMVRSLGTESLYLPAYIETR